jgi:hypothetical protein
MRGLLLYHPLPQGWVGLSKVEIVTRRGDFLMDVWVFMASKEPHLTQVPPYVVIEVFAFEPSTADKKRALRDFLDRKLGWDSYEKGEEGLRKEDLDRLMYHWPESLFRVPQRSLRVRGEW